MEYNIISKETYPIVQVDMNVGEQFKLETGSMLSMTNNIVIEGKRNGSLFGALGKAILGGENFFITTATSHAPNQKLTIAPKGIGSIYHIPLDGTKNWYLEDGVFLASDITVDFDIQRQSGIASPLFAGTGGFFILKTSGYGNLFVESFGEILEIEVTEDNPITVDNNHVIGWEETVHHQIVVASGTFGFTTGEGLAIKLSGRGKVLIQTRNAESFAKTITPFIPSQK